MKSADEFLSTRLFPKNNGADKYNITGVAQLCDWVILSDWKRPEVVLVKHLRLLNPKTIFVSFRNVKKALAFFVEEVLVLLTEPFVLVTGSEDVTIPVQVDRRWPPLTDLERALIWQIARHPLLSHWFVENLDSNFSDKVTPLPLGMVYADGSAPRQVKEVDRRSLKDRTKLVFCSHRVRDGEQWALRRNVTELALNDWRSFCTVESNELSEHIFFQLVQQHRFVLCVEGGGLDPSPKAWQAILHGAIPIINTTAVTPAYKDLPVVTLTQWSADSITEEKLKCWYQELLPFFEDGDKRQQVLYRLSREYWWQKISKKIVSK